MRANKGKKRSGSGVAIGRSRCERWGGKLVSGRGFGQTGKISKLDADRLLQLQGSPRTW